MKEFMKNLKEKGLTYFFVGVVAVSTLALSFLAFLFADSIKTEKSNNIIGKKAAKFVEEHLDNDSDLLKESEALDLYEAINNDPISDKQITVLEQGENDYRTQSPTIEEFRNSIINIKNNQEETNILTQDYETVISYMLLHMDEDNSDFLRETFSVIMDSLYNRNIKDQIEINSIIPVSDQTIVIEATVNGQNMTFTTNDAIYYNLISKAILKDKSFLENLRNATSIIKSTAELNSRNEIVQKEEDFNSSYMYFLLGSMAIVVVAGIMSTKKDKQKTNKK